MQPTPYNLLSGDVSIRKEFNRLTTAIGFRTDSYAYGSTVAQNGAVINQDNQDGQIYSLHGRVDYAISPMLGWFAGAEGNQRNHECHECPCFASGQSEPRMGVGRRIGSPAKQREVHSKNRKAG